MTEPPCPLCERPMTVSFGAWWCHPCAEPVAAAEPPAGRRVGITSMESALSYFRRIYARGDLFRLANRPSASARIRRA